MLRQLATLAVVLMMILLPATSRAQWLLDGAPVGAGPGHQYLPIGIADGSGGAFIVWQVSNTLYVDNVLRMQRIDAYGVPQWGPEGVPLIAVPDGQQPDLLADGTGGVFVVWVDSRSADYYVYAQRLNGAGVPLWTPNGVVVANAGYSAGPKLATDGAGGVIVTWYDYRNGFDFDIYAQKISAAGTAQWTASGVPVCTVTDGQFEPVIVSDGAGGGFVSWYDLRTGDYDVYAQRVNASGAAQWAANGIAVCALANMQANPRILAAGGDAILAWRDARNGNVDIYAQRLNASGAFQWAANGVPVCTATGDQNAWNLVSDGGGGALLAWDDSRNGVHLDVYAQRLNSSGAALWSVDGVLVCNAPDSQYMGPIAPDGAGGMVMTWHDPRTWGLTGFDIYGQRLNASGVAQWAINGVPFCTAAGDQVYPIVVSDGGSAIATWYDWRSGNSDVYAQRIEFAEQYWGHPEPAAVSAADIPGDQGGKVKVNWQASDWDVRHRNTIMHYSVWRATEFEPAPTSLVASANEIGADFDGVAFRREVSASGDEYYWEWVGNQAAIYSPRYSFSASTRSDSTSQGNAGHFFQVLAHTWDNFVFWTSNVVSGYSVDNLAPAAPLYLTAQRVGSDVNLKWNRAVAPDLRDYQVYRATATGVAPVPLNFLSSSEDTVLVDTSAPASALYYIVTAIDVHENQSAPSNEANVGATTNVGNTPAITALTLLQNHPNPFSAATDLSIGLPTASDLSIEVYDVAGRRVRSLDLKGVNAGWRRVPFDGTDGVGRPLASGVYFCRVTAAGSTATRKMVIAR